jgi:cell shape-determining protein MreC
MASRRTSTWRAATVLVAISVIAVLLPTSMTSRLSDIIQVFIPFQDAVTRTTASRDSRRRDGAAENDRLRSIVETLLAENENLRQDNEMLTRVRNRGLGHRGRLIPARVVAGDTSIWRQSKLILGGTRRGISNGLGVLSNEFSIDTGDSEGAANGMAILASESLVGVIESTGTHSSRVRLLSDPNTRMPVGIARIEDDSTIRPLDAVFWMIGKGHGRIEVRDVHHRYIDAGDIRVGDIVLTPSDGVDLPPSVSIGDITDMHVDPDNGLLYTLTVSPRVRPGAIRRVYVADLNP